MNPKMKNVDQRKTVAFVLGQKERKKKLTKQNKTNTFVDIGSIAKWLSTN